MNTTDSKTNNNLGSKSHIEFKPLDFESKWQRKWEEDKLYSPDLENAKNPYFNLMMFPYPSAEGLHVGNMYAFTGADVYARFNRMQGKDVLEPIGLDGFGIHSENYALKVGRHPKEQAQISEKNFYRQLRSIGNSFDFERTVETYNPNYYKWTQWLFIQMFKNGLAYRDKAMVNWCPSCKTVLSDEQVLQKTRPVSPNLNNGEGVGIEVSVGVCERCDSEVEKRELEQWFFRIKDYAQRLLDNTDSLNWSEKVKIAQRNWIGRSEGAEIDFKIDGFGDSESLRVFTTRPDTLHGATFMVIAPEHQLADKIANGSIPNTDSQAVKEYILSAKNKSEIERTGEDKKKTGVVTGLYAINPVSNEKIPVLVCDYVLGGYGTGAIMAVPAHDQRDFDTAKAFDLPIKSVIRPYDGEAKDVSFEHAYEGDGVLIESSEWNGWEVPKDISRVIDWLDERGIGTRKANFHLRDWLISRQRYWGPPIPMIYCQTCHDKGESWFTTHESRMSDHNSLLMLHDSNMPGWFPVEEDHLPVELPDVSDWKPMGTGKSPLANHPEFYKTICPNCGSEATRETDVSDTFLDSAWYFLRYLATEWDDMPFPSAKLAQEMQKQGNLDQEKIENSAKRAAFLPVKQYIGGAEHAVLHLLYSRFVTMALKDMGYIDFEEPFTNFFAHGLIIKDGAKMSKSKGNVVVPDEYIGKYGADTLRSYLMFIGPYSDGGDFRDSGIEGMHKFLRRVWNLLQKSIFGAQMQNHDRQKECEDRELDSKMHLTIKEVTDDIQNFKYNTAIAHLMEYYNSLNDFYIKNKMLDIKYAKIFLQLLAPFAPHMTEEIWAKLGNNSSIHLSSWPSFDEAMLISDEIVIPIQINGKRRGEVTVSRNELSDQMTIEAKAKDAVNKYLAGHEVRKTIYINGKIINFVI